jgi:monofunctional biosynthetic peptidoglycan transglycosylase
MKRVRRWLLLLLAAGLLGSLLPVLVFRWLPPPGSAVILQRALSEGRSQDYRWTPIERIAPEMALAVVAAEDQTFPRHWGFDLVQIRAAVRDYAEGERLRGASTLSQQVARNLFLWQGRSLVRKGLEVWFTALIELVWSKRRILEVYLNIAELGERTFGVEAASQRYFGIPAGRLNADQAALLSAVLPNPIERRVDQPSAYVRQRQRWVLRQMRQLGGIAYLDGLLDKSGGRGD